MPDAFYEWELSWLNYWHDNPKLYLALVISCMTIWAAATFAGRRR